MKIGSLFLAKHLVVSREMRNFAAANHTRMKFSLKYFLVLMAMTAVLPLKSEVSPRIFEVFNASNGLSDNSAQTIRCTRTGRLVITTTGLINFYDGNQFTYIDPTNENIYPLEAYSGNYHLYFDRYHHLWLKDRHSVTCVNLTTEQFTESIPGVFAEFGVNQKVLDLFTDSDGILFLLLHKGLYSVASKRYYKVRPDRNLQDVETYGDKYLLLFYDNGELDVQELSTGTVVSVTRGYSKADADGYSSTSVLCEIGSRYYQIRNGRQGAVLQCFDIGKWAWTEMMRTPYHLSNIEPRDSILYVPCQRGYWTIDTTNGDLHHFDTLQLMSGRSLSTNLNALVFDRQGGMWVGTESRGLLYARPYNVPFTVYSLTAPEARQYVTMMESLPVTTQFRDKRANCVVRDSRGRTWVGTASGLHLYKSPDEKLPVVYTRRHGLLNNVVHTIVEDHLHNIWVGTSYGLSCLLFDGKGEFLRILSYNAYDRIPVESFTNGRAMCLADGLVAMQTQDHVITFRPEAMRTLSDSTHFKIYPKLVKLLVNGNEVRTGEPFDGHIILDKALTRTKEINVDYDLNSLSLTFSALNYFRPQQTCYRVRVLGHNDTWQILTSYNSHGLVDRKGQLHLPLPALKPGTYTIQLQTSMSPDEWTTEPYEWTVNVLEPWWRTTGIFILMGLILLALMLVNVWLYVRNISMRTRRSSEEQGVIRRLKLFADYGHGPQGEPLAPSLDEITSLHADTAQASLEFVEVMLQISDTVRRTPPSRLSMKMLSTQAGMDLQQFYSLVTTNIYKNPQMLIRRVALQSGETLLRTTDRDVADIAAECGFVSPNFFIAAFFREYGLLPEEYRRRHHSLL